MRADRRGTGISGSARASVACGSTRSDPAWSPSGERSCFRPASAARRCGYAMVLLQAMFTLAIEWGEAQANPVSVVRKPRQGRQRAIEPTRARGHRASARGPARRRRPPLCHAGQRPRLRRPTARRGTRPRMAPRPRPHAVDRASGQRRPPEAPEDQSRRSHGRPSRAARGRPRRLEGGVMHGPVRLPAAGWRMFCELATDESRDAVDRPTLDATQSAMAT